MLGVGEGCFGVTGLPSSHKCLPGMDWELEREAEVILVAY